MASKRDKLEKAARKQLNGRDKKGSMSEPVKEIERGKKEEVTSEDKNKDQNMIHAGGGKENFDVEKIKVPTNPENFPLLDGNDRAMPKPRSSIYNVNTDIRLEDYTESGPKRGSNIIKIGSGILLFGLIVWGAVTVFGIIFAPTYKLAIATHEINQENIDQFLTTPALKPEPGGAVHIRFQWDEGGLNTDLLIIRAEKDVAGKYREIASKSRGLPVTATYIYFTNVLEPGKYRIQVRNRKGKILKERVIRIQ